MAMLLEKTYERLQIVGHRTNYQGEIYTVQSAGYLDTVIVAGEQATCTCHKPNCEHIQAARRQIRREAAADSRRRVIEATFDLSYGDRETCA